METGNKALTDTLEATKRGDTVANLMREIERLKELAAETDHRRLETIRTVGEYNRWLSEELRKARGRPAEQFALGLLGGIAIGMGSLIFLVMTFG